MSHREHRFMALLRNNAKRENRGWERKGGRNDRNSATLIKFFQIKIANTISPNAMHDTAFPGISGSSD